MKTHLTGLPRALLVLAVTYAVGCTCDETDVVLDDFQFCDDGCGWVADSGEALLTSRTFHSAELGLVIPSGVSARRSGGVRGEELHVVSERESLRVLTFLVALEWA